MESPELLNIIVDKGILATLLLIFGLWVSRAIESYKSALELQRNTAIIIAESRIPSFTLLWELTLPTSPTRENPLSQKEKTDLNEKMKTWYYKDAGGLFLTNELRETYLAARDSLINGSEDSITEIFSSLRTKLKNEIGIYGVFEENKA